MELTSSSRRRGRGQGGTSRSCLENVTQTVLQWVRGGLGEDRERQEGVDRVGQVGAGRRWAVPEVLAVVGRGQ